MRNIRRLALESEFASLGIMKTTVDIPDKELKDLMRLTKATTKREAIVAAVTDYNRRKKMAELVKYVGTFKNMMTQEELMKMRWAGHHTFDQ